MPDIKPGWHRGKLCAVWCDEYGRRRRHSLGTADPVLAQTRLAAFKRHLTTASAETPLTLADIFSAYIEDRAGEDKPTERMAFAWQRLKPTFGPLRPADLDKSHVGDYIATRRAAKIGDGTIHTELVYLRAALTFAVNSGWITKAPHIRVPERPAPREHHLTRVEARALIDAAVMPHVRLFIRLALATAGRAGAILELTWDRVDLDRRRIYLHDPARFRTRKGRATVPINDGLHKALSDARCGALSPYVVEWGGEKVVSVKKGVAAAARRAGIKCSPHVLRHTAAVWMAEARVDMATIAQYLGHDDDRTTQRVYARFSPDFLAEAARALEV